MDIDRSHTKTKSLFSRALDSDRSVALLTTFVPHYQIPHFLSLQKFTFTGLRVRHDRYKFLLAIQYEGFFDPDHPNAFNRNYHLTVGALNGGNNPDWTVFLPVNAGESAYQVTNLGEPFTTDPTAETFTDDLPMLFASQQDALNAGKTVIDELTNPNNPGGESIWVGYNQLSLTQFKPHGTGASTPEPSTILGSIAIVGVGSLLKNKKKHSKN